MIPGQREVSIPGLVRIAIERAPSMKSGFFTILSMHDWTDSLMEIIVQDALLTNCFVE